MKKWQTITVEWISFYAALFIYAYFQYLFLPGYAYEGGIAEVIGASLGYAVIPLAITLIIFLIRIISNKEQKYEFFARTLWITSVVVLLLSTWGMCMHRKGGYICFVFTIPLIIGAIYWTSKHPKCIQQDNKQNSIDATTPSSDVDVIDRDGKKNL